jgi:hypothetical protein
MTLHLLKAFYFYPSIFFLLSPYTTEQWLAYHWWYAYHSLSNPALENSKLVLDIPVEEHIKHSKQHTVNSNPHSSTADDSINWKQTVAFPTQQI